MKASDWLARRSQLSPDKIALIDAASGHKISYRCWNQQCNRTANYLQKKFGVGKGDLVAVLAGNSIEYLDLCFACHKLGAILQALNWRLAPGELQGLLTQTPPRVLCYSEELIDKIRQLRRHLPTTCCIALTSRLSEEDQAFTERMEFSEQQPPAVEIDSDDPWIICYTGGSTGLPKGAILTHGNITWNAVNTVISWGLDSNDIVILNAPLFHTGGLNVFMMPLVYVGGSSILCHSFDPDQVFDLIATSEATLLFGVPTIFVMLQQHPRWQRANFSRFKIVISGGAPCPLPVCQKFWNKGIDFKLGYGLTEAGPNNFWLPSRDVRRKPGSVGFPLFHVEVKLQDANGQAIVRPDIPGELLLRGPHRIPGYWNNPQASSETIDSDGWLHTGDLAQFDSEGYYYIVGRHKEMIISGGENIYPAEVESIIHEHPAVAEVAVIGIPDPRWGEAVRAVLVLKANCHLTAEQLQEYCLQRLARYKIPKSVLLVNELPKTSTGKIDKRRLSS